MCKHDHPPGPISKSPPPRWPMPCWWLPTSLVLPVTCTSCRRSSAGSSGRGGWRDWTSSRPASLTTSAMCTNLMEWENNLIHTTNGIYMYVWCCTVHMYCMIYLTHVYIQYIDVNCSQSSTVHVLCMHLHTVYTCIIYNAIMLYIAINCIVIYHQLQHVMLAWRTYIPLHAILYVIIKDSYMYVREYLYIIKLHMHYSIYMIHDPGHRFLKPSSLKCTDDSMPGSFLVSFAWFPRQPKFKHFREWKQFGWLVLQ